MISMDEQIELFKIIGNTLNEKIECVLVGGSAMMFYNCKESTKDIDLVALNKQNFNLLKKAFLDSGFKLRKFKFVYQDLSKEKPIFFINKENQRIDLFINY